MKKVFLISCVGQKRDHATLAKDLYISDWFKKAWAYCWQKSSPDSETYILSAKWGLLWSGSEIEPYEMSLIGMPIAERKAWSAKVIKQIGHQEKLQGLTLVILAGDKYREFLVPALEAAGAIVEIPMKGLGIGDQLSFLKKNTKEEPWKLQPE